MTHLKLRVQSSDRDPDYLEHRINEFLAAQYREKFTDEAKLTKVKAGIIARGTGLGVDYSRTMNCYDPVEESSKDGFLHCGRCDDCVLRKKGFSEAGVEDPTAYHR